MSLFQPWHLNRKRIVILRALQLGDLLCSVPAFRALRGAYPSAHITLVGLPWSEAFVERFSAYLDDFIPFPGFPGFPEQAPQVIDFPAFLERMQGMQIDLAIQMQGPGGSANSLVSLWGAKSSAGFCVAGKYCPDESQYLEYPERESEVWRHLKLMQFLGIPLKGDELEFPLFDEDWEALRKIQKDQGLEDGYICIHAGARAATRRWPLRRFAEVADGLAEQGCRIVLTGSEEEIPLANEVAAQMRFDPINLAGKTGLGALGALVSQASLLVSNDTGISHVAAALQTPSVILFSGSDPRRWAPQNKALHRVVLYATTVPASEVLQVAKAHLASTSTYQLMHCRKAKQVYETT